MTIQDSQAKWAQQAKEQQQVNQLALTEPAELVRQAVIDLANLHHKSYPQYSNHYNRKMWRLVRFRRQQKTSKGLVCFERGDTTIAYLQFRGVFFECSSVVAYSIRDAVDCQVDQEKIEWIQQPGNPVKN